MGTMRMILLGAAISAMLAGPAAAQAQATVIAEGSATILDPAQISEQHQLSVATVSRPSTGSATAVASAGSYTVLGQGGQAYSVSAPSSLTLVRAGGTEQVEVKLTSTNTSGTFAGAADQASSTTVGVGGSVPVTSATKSGTYEGQYGVTLSYQ